MQTPLRMCGEKRSNESAVPTTTTTTMRCRISIGLRVALGQHDVRVDSDAGIGCGSDSDGIIRCLAEAATSVANERLACER